MNQQQYPLGRFLTRAFCTVALSYTGIANAEVNIVDSSFASGDYIPYDGGFNLSLEESRDDLAFFIDTTDITDLLSQDGAQWIYSPDAPPLPTGQREVVIYQVIEGEPWEELARVPINILTPSGFEESELTPQLDIVIKAQLASDTEGDATPLERETFQDFEVQAGLSSQQRREDLEFRSSANIVSFSHRPDTLRFDELDDDSPKTDLSDYLLELDKGASSVALGHVFYGNHPLLVDSISNRGVAAQYRINEQFDVSLGLMNGTSIVGYNNIFGLSRFNDHRIAAATFGMELLPERPGGLRAEFTYMDSERQDEDDFNVGEISDAEDNRGFGLRLLGSDESGRLRGQVNYARSRYVNPNDPNLDLDDPDTEIVEVKPSTDNAYSAEVNYDILQGEPLVGETLVSLTSSFRYAYADALYNSLGAFVDANLELYTAGLDGQIGDVSTQLAYTHSQDNVDDLDTLLTTRTRSLIFSVNMPTQPLFGDPDNPQSWWPDVTYALERVHQQAVNTPDPELSGFDDPSQLPNQVTRVDNLDFTWFGEQWDASYRLSYSNEDNRQTGREQADFKTLEHAVNFGFRPLTDLSLNLGASRVRSHDNEQSLVDYSNTYTVGLDWVFWNDWAFNGSLTYIDEDDNANIAERDSTTVQAQVSYRFELPGPSGRKLPGQWFLRYDREKLNELDNEFELDSSATTWTISSGLSFSFY